MKVLIVTTQRHFNFGTLLQCHALQHYLESQGCDVDVLDYLGKEYSRSGISRFRILLGDLRRHPFKYLQILLNSRKRQKRKKLFKKFLKERVNLTQSKYATLIDIKRNIHEYDVYIAGSDQIWNPRLGGFKPTYFLKFAPKQRQKISYAASFGIDSFNEKEKEDIQSMVEDFTAISCREQSGIDFLNSAGIDSTLTVDPTFLLSADYWREISDRQTIKKTESGYVLTYFLSESAPKTEMGRHFIKDKNVNLINLSVNDNAPSDSILGVGPEQFLTLIDNCDLLITDSFHGIVFSIIFHKDFYIVPRSKNHSDSQNTRIINLLTALNLMDRWIPSLELPDHRKEIDYSIVDALLKNHISASTNWLKSQLMR